MAKPKDLGALIEFIRTTQTLLSHYQSSLAPPKNGPSTPPTLAVERLRPLHAIKATAALLRSHMTTLSLLLITPPLTPSAVITKISNVSSGVLGGMVAAASYTPAEEDGSDIGNLMRVEVKAQVRRLLGTWGDVLAVILDMAETRRSKAGKAGAKIMDGGPTDTEKNNVLAVTGVVWEACDALASCCEKGAAGLAVQKASAYRTLLLDAVTELQEWGEDVDDDEGGAEFSDEDVLGASNKLGRDDKELRELLDKSVKKLKMVGMLYRALVKRRLSTYPMPSTLNTSSQEANNSTASNPGRRLDGLMALLKTIPETVDDLASAFYDLDQEEAQKTLDLCCLQAENAAALVKRNWTNTEDEFTTWSSKWMEALRTT